MVTHMVSENMLYLDRIQPGKERQCMTYHQGAIGTLDSSFAVH